METHQFELTGSWEGGLSGQGKIALRNLNSDVSAPTELGGIGKGTNPEEMLLGSAATCYLITLGSILERRKWNVSDLTITSEAKINAAGGLKFESIIHRPKITIGRGISDEQKEEIRKIALRAEHACMISKALKGNVLVTVEPIIEEDE